MKICRNLFHLTTARDLISKLPQTSARPLFNDNEQCSCSENLSLHVRNAMTTYTAGSQENPGHRPLRGWLVTSTGFDKHSVVDRGRGGLLDITHLETALIAVFFSSMEASTSSTNCPARIIALDILILVDFGNLPESTSLIFCVCLIQLLLQTQELAKLIHTLRIGSMCVWGGGSETRNRFRRLFEHNIDGCAG